MNKKVLFFIVGIIIIGAGLGIFFFRNSTKNSPSPSPNSSEQNSSQMEKNNEGTSEIPVEPTFTDFPGDKDHDRILDAKEKEMGLSDTQFDTDADGIADYNEINTFHTDPTKKDTDGDGFADGYEVSKGYNPNGAGKLETSGNQ